MLGSEGQRLFLVKSAVLISQHFYILSRSMNDTYYTLRFDEKNRMKIDFLRANMHKFSRQITNCSSSLTASEIADIHNICPYLLCSNILP